MNNDGDFIGGTCVFGTAEGFSYLGYGVLNIPEKLEGRLFDRRGQEKGVVQFAGETIHFHFVRHNGHAYYDICGRIQIAKDFKRRDGIIGAAIAIRRQDSELSHFKIASTWLDAQFNAFHQDNIENGQIIIDSFKNSSFIMLEDFSLNAPPITDMSHLMFRRLALSQDIDVHQKEAAIFNYLAQIEGYSDIPIIFSSHGFQQAHHTLNNETLIGFDVQLREQKRQARLRENLGKYEEARRQGLMIANRKSTLNDSLHRFKEELTNLENEIRECDAEQADITKTIDDYKRAIEKDGGNVSSPVARNNMASITRSVPAPPTRPTPISSWESGSDQIYFADSPANNIQRPPANLGTYSRTRQPQDRSAAGQENHHNQNRHRTREHNSMVDEAGASIPIDNRVSFYIRNNGGKIILFTVVSVLCLAIIYLLNAMFFSPVEQSSVIDQINDGQSYQASGEHINPVSDALKACQTIEDSLTYVKSPNFLEQYGGLDSSVRYDEKFEYAVSKFFDEYEADIVNDMLLCAQAKGHRPDRPNCSIKTPNNFDPENLNAKPDKYKRSARKAIYNLATCIDEY